MSIFILTVSNDEESYDLYFSNQEKAVNFISDNFNNDNPRKVTNDLFEGKTNIYTINSQMVDQKRM